MRPEWPEDPNATSAAWRNPGLSAKIQKLLGAAHAGRVARRQ